MAEVDLMYYLPVISLRGKRVLMKLIVAIIVSIILSVSSALTLYLLYGVGEAIMPFSEKASGSKAAILNAIYMLIIVVIMTFFILLLIKKRKIGLLKAMLLIVMSFICGISAGLVLPLWVTIAFLYVFLVLNIQINAYFIQTLYSVVYYAILLTFSIGMAFSIIYRWDFLRNVFILLSAAWIGVLFGLYSGRLTPLVLMGIFATYDIIAVMKGPLRMLINEIRLTKQKVSLKTQPILGLGAGDILFYSLAVSYSVGWIQPFSHGLMCALLVSFVCVFGLIITILLAHYLNKAAAPALPISMFLALMVIIIFITL